MNSYLLALILGIVEGLTEFLPVSSTAHLRICQQLMGISLSDGYWKMFAIVIQLGAILCLPLYFRERIRKFVVSFPQGDRGDRTALTHPLTLVVIAFLCTAIPAFLMRKLIGDNLESPLVFGCSLLLGGLIMWVIDDRYERRVLPLTTEHTEEMTLKQSVWIGCCQVLSAVFPGTSRSMSTIAAGQLAGMSREAALEFSFFLSIPTMAVATVYDLYKAIHPGKGEASVLGQISWSAEHWITLGIGFVVSFIVAYFVVAWFMKWVRARGFVPFAIYRILLGAGVLWAVSRHM